MSKGADELTVCMRRRAGRLEGAGSNTSRSDSQKLARPAAAIAAALAPTAPTPARTSGVATIAVPSAETAPLTIANRPSALAA